MRFVLASASSLLAVLLISGCSQRTLSNDDPDASVAVDGGGLAGDCTLDSDCPASLAPCQPCADGSFACTTMSCTQGKCVANTDKCPPPECQVPGDCAVDDSCKPCPDGSCAGYQATCEKGRCGGAWLQCSGQCMSDKECPAPPPFCQTCPDGSQACPRAVCGKGGVCGVETPTCGVTVCKQDSDCDSGGCAPCQDGTCGLARCVGGACSLECGVPQCKIDDDCPKIRIPCKLCSDGSASCPTSRCDNGACSIEWSMCPPVIPARCGKVVCGAGTACCNGSCSLCLPEGRTCIQIACEHTPVGGGCVRSSGDACNDDSDCIMAGCGGELCHNPKVSSGMTDCDCKAPVDHGCGCVNGQCTWWK